MNEGWKNADGTITLTAPQVDVALTGPLPEFTVGGRYLVTAAGSTINACGYTLDYDAETAATVGGGLRQLTRTTPERTETPSDGGVSSCRALPQRRAVE